MSDGVAVPTKIRVMNASEYKIVSRVFGSTLPYNWRILITNCLGLRGAPFTIPTSLISTSVPSFAGILAGYASSVVNAGYIINVGSDYSTLSGNTQRLLIHETAHVWQGKNSLFALSYVFDSCINQCLHGNAATVIRRVIPGVRTTSSSRLPSSKIGSGLASRNRETFGVTSATM